MKPLLIIGAGGHASVVAEMLRALGRTVLGTTETDSRRHGGTLLEFPVLGDDGILDKHPPDTVELALGIGSTGDHRLRRALFDRLAAQGYVFPVLVHPAAWVAPSARLSPGVQVMAGAVIQARCCIGVNAIINTRAGVDHDCVVGAHAHIAPGATLCGDVGVGDGGHVGPGAVVTQGCTIGEGSVIAAGAVVHRSVEAGCRVAGVPAKEMKP